MNICIYKRLSFFDEFQKNELNEFLLKFRITIKGDFLIREKTVEVAVDS